MRSRLALLALLAAACPPATEEVDQPAARLDVALSVVDLAVHPTDGKVLLLVQFSLDGQSVDLGGAATVTCNGVALAFGGIGYEGRVAQVAPGGSYGCVHVRAGVSTTVAVTVPARPVLLAPGAGATVARSRSLSLGYVADGGAAVRASAGDGVIAVGGPDEPDTGSYTGFDVTALRPGAGTITLARDITTDLAGTGFRSARATFTIGSAEVAVSWS